jgi:hypothetical protein
VRIDEVSLTPSIGPDRKWDRAALLSQWNLLIERYTRRHLTNAKDRAVAMAGIAERFSTLLDSSGYIAGLWKTYFHPSLLWRIERDNIMPRPTTYQGPSWSWTSVKGPVSFPHLLLRF